MSVKINVATSKPGYFAGETVEGTLTVCVVSGCLTLHDDGCPEKRDIIVSVQSSKISQEIRGGWLLRRGIDGGIDSSINYILAEIWMRPC